MHVIGFETRKYIIYIIIHIYCTVTNATAITEIDPYSPIPFLYIGLHHPTVTIIYNYI